MRKATLTLSKLIEIFFLDTLNSEKSSRLEVSQRSETREHIRLGADLPVGEAVDKSRLTTDEQAALGKVELLV